MQQAIARAAGMYEDMRTGPHHLFRIEGGKSQDSTKGPSIKDVSSKG